MADLNEVYARFYKNIRDSDLLYLIELMDRPGFDVNYQNPDMWGYTPFMAAVLYDRADVAEELVKRGATLKNPTPGKATYIDVAVQKGSVNMVNFLLSKGVNFNNHTIKLAKGVEDNEDIVNILETWDAKQSIPPFNAVGPYMGIGSWHNENLKDMADYAGKRSEYGKEPSGGRRRRKKTKKNKKRRKSLKRRKSIKRRK